MLTTCNTCEGTGRTLSGWFVRLVLGMTTRQCPICLGSGQVFKVADGITAEQREAFRREWMALHAGSSGTITVPHIDNCTVSHHPSTEPSRRW